VTCIAGIVEPSKRVVWIGGDSAATSGYDLSIVLDTKVFYHTGTNFIVGCCGSVRATNVIRYKMTPPEPTTDDDMAYMVTGFVESLRESLKAAGNTVKNDEMEWTGVQLLVGYHAKLFMIDSDYQVREVVTGYDSIGAGADLALGALYATAGTGAKKRMTLAMEAAAVHNTACRPPFSILRARWSE
jgi:ATP-dependent protease HslVU (ClpYQ) peptidase subunit